MAGKVVVSTLNNDTGVLATQNGMTGIAKAWVNINGSSGASPTIRDSFNVSSVTRTGTGAYTVSFTTAMPNANYSAVGMPSSDGVAARYVYINGGSGALTTTSVLLQIVNGSTSSAADATYLGVIVIGS